MVDEKIIIENVNGIQAEHLLASRNVHGSYLVRRSNTVPHAYCLCVWSGGSGSSGISGFHQYRINYTGTPQGDGLYFIKNDNSCMERRFDSLQTLLNYYISRGENNGLAAPLLHPHHDATEKNHYELEKDFNSTGEQRRKQRQEYLLKKLSSLQTSKESFVKNSDFFVDFERYLQESFIVDHGREKREFKKFIARSLATFQREALLLDWRMKLLMSLVNEDSRPLSALSSCDDEDPYNWLRSLSNLAHRWQTIEENLFQHEENMTLPSPSDSSKVNVHETRVFETNQVEEASPPVTRRSLVRRGFRTRLFEVMDLSNISKNMSPGAMSTCEDDAFHRQEGFTVCSNRPLTKATNRLLLALDCERDILTVSRYHLPLSLTKDAPNSLSLSNCSFEFDSCHSKDSVTNADSSQTSLVKECTLDASKIICVRRRGSTDKRELNHDRKVLILRYFTNTSPSRSTQPHNDTSSVSSLSKRSDETLSSSCLSELHVEFACSSTMEEFLLEMYRLKLMFPPTGCVANGLKIFIGTWNKGGEDIQHDLNLWLFGSETLPGDKRKGVYSGNDIYVIGTQEDDQDSQFWLNLILNSLDHGTGNQYFVISNRAYWRMRIVVLCRPELQLLLTNVNESQVAVGVLNRLGNKGAVGVAFTLHRRQFCFINCHLDCGAANYSRRIESMRRIFEELKFPLCGLSATSLSSCDLLQQFDYLFFFGDTNFRVETAESVTQVENSILLGHFHHFLCGDQILVNKSQCDLLGFFQEGKIEFPPTYRYKKGSVTQFASVKESPLQKVKIHTPSWCDRVLYWCRPQLSCSATDYGSVPTFSASDHKPVFCSVEVDFAYDSINPSKNIMALCDGIEQIQLNISSITLKLNKMDEKMISSTEVVIAFHSLVFQNSVQEFISGRPSLHRDECNTTLCWNECFPTIYLQRNQSISSVQHSHLYILIWEKTLHPFFKGSAVLSLHKLVSDTPQIHRVPLKFLATAVGELSITCNITAALPSSDAYDNSTLRPSSMNASTSQIPKFISSHSQEIHSSKPSSMTINDKSNANSNKLTTDTVKPKSSLPVSQNSLRRSLPPSSTSAFRPIKTANKQMTMRRPTQTNNNSSCVDRSRQQQHVRSQSLDTRSSPFSSIQSTDKENDMTEEKRSDKNDVIKISDTLRYGNAQSQERHKTATVKSYVQLQSPARAYLPASQNRQSHLSNERGGVDTVFDVPNLTVHNSLYARTRTPSARRQGVSNTVRQLDARVDVEQLELQLRTFSRQSRDSSRSKLVRPNESCGENTLHNLGEHIPSHQSQLLTSPLSPTIPPLPPKVPARHSIANPDGTLIRRRCKYESMDEIMKHVSLDGGQATLDTRNNNISPVSTVFSVDTTSSSSSLALSSADNSPDKFRSKESSMKIDTSVKYAVPHRMLKSPSAHSVNTTTVNESQDTYISLPNPSNVLQWLTSVHLECYVTLFLTSQVWHSLSKVKLMNEKDLLELGIRNRQHRQLLLESLNWLPYS